MNKNYAKYWFKNIFFSISHLEEIKLIQDNKKYKLFIKEKGVLFLEMVHLLMA